MLWTTAVAELFRSRRWRRTVDGWVACLIEETEEYLAALTAPPPPRPRKEPPALS